MSDRISCVWVKLSVAVISVSGIAADHEIMGVFTAGTHGSTFGGYPQGLLLLLLWKFWKKKNLADNAEELGKYFRAELKQMVCPKIVQVRGKGLLNAIVFEKFWCLECLYRFKRQRCLS